MPVGFSNLGDATSGALSIAGALSNGTPPASLGNGVSLALGRFGTGDVDFGFLVRAIASDADNNILSTPKHNDTGQRRGGDHCGPKCAVCNRHTAVRQ